MRKKNLIIGISIILPSIIAIAVFVYGFISWTVRTSFSNWNSFSALLRGTYKFVGLRNYIRLFQDSRFQIDLWNTLFFTVFFLLGTITLGVVMAILVDKGLKGSRIFQNLFLFPMAISFVVTGTVWSWIFAPGNIPSNPQGINLLFQKLGLEKLMWGWYTSTYSIGKFNVALIPVIIAAIWQLSGYTMAMYLAGLRGIPNDIIEAAKVDGASEWKIFWKIKMPLLTPITLSALIILGHISLKIFDLVFSMTGSGPNFVTDVPAIYMFELTFRSNRYAMGSAIAIVMLLFVTVVIIPYLITSLRGERR
ncbi:sugar ABC transporter permease [Thermosipho melanesiensis]|uniref:Binding-protein-dependent transport systems inner membrane component n=2 Tax=Thermosipho melanesiensis TaxID=46541 RepID=A6LL79_THEM4|nr:sugar ABC transporter permease [Thermosipho melanesiensis]ABR30680.1 binding-protein-dependent transport systems inner membrane component [Thermosipho melanesiensis BI429]APT73812.1 sugar ABC transporter permease [Thermosipho melanesiensis]OOC35751.1 sugar ABC transporter permease [Thermosipho melanesiensis]OOC39050.1 sugar ABC transporter permease [Thermosipho melanesiensis]OOC39198.1 sugar ABC transporter permease [Thermosipho melanesiensis]